MSVWYPVTWNWSPAESVLGVMVAEVVTSLNTRSPTGVCGQYSS